MAERTAKEEIRNYYAVEELAAIDRQFSHMIAGQSVAFIIVNSALSGRKTLVNLLSQAGFDNVYETRTGFEALEVVKKNLKLRMVTLADFAISGMDALSYLRNFRQLVVEGVMFLTGNRIPPLKVKEAMALGVIVLNSPISEKVLLEKLTEKNIVAEE